MKITSNTHFWLFYCVFFVSHTRCVTEASSFCIATLIKIEEIGHIGVGVREGEGVIKICILNHSMFQEVPEHEALQWLKLTKAI